MNQRGVQPDVQTYNSLLRALGKALDVTRVEQLFAHMQRDGPTPDMVTWTALIAAYVRSSMVRLAPCRWIHSCMERNDLRPWQHTECSLMLQGLEAFSAWERMQETELEYKPSQWTLACNATIRACARSDLTDCARAVLDKLLLSGAEPTIASFQPLVCRLLCMQPVVAQLARLIMNVFLRSKPYEKRMIRLQRKSMNSNSDTDA